MAIQFDHIVFFVGHLEKAVEHFRTKGFHVVYGGSHSMWGTYNALIYFEDKYIELIAIEKEAIYKQAAKERYTLHESYEESGRTNGYTRFAIRTEDVKSVAQSFREQDFEVIGPEPFSRLTKSGELIEWELLHIGKRTSTRSIPFIIDWKRQNEERMLHLKKQGVIAPHANGTLALSKLTIFGSETLHLAEFYNAIQVPYTVDEDRFVVTFNNFTVEQKFQQNEMKARIEFTSSTEIPSFVYEGTEFIFKK